MMLLGLLALAGVALSRPQVPPGPPMSTGPMSTGPPSNVSSSLPPYPISNSSTTMSTSMGPIPISPTSSSLSPAMPTSSSSPMSSMTSAPFPFPNSTISSSSAGTDVGPTSSPTGCAALSSYHDSVTAANPTATAIDGCSPRWVVDCLNSVPIDPADVANFTEWALQIWGFQSTLDQLKNPPPSYQRPATDTLGRLTALNASVASGAITSQYAFELAVLQIVHDAYDQNFQISLPLLDAFVFSASTGLLSAAPSPDALPQIYCASDIYGQVFNPSPVVSINGKAAADWLYQLGLGVPLSNYYIDMNAEYNDYFPNAARSVGYGRPKFDNHTSTLTHMRTYPGTDQFNLVLANGTIVPGSITASFDPSRLNFSIPVGSAIYNYFVRQPADAVPSLAAAAQQDPNLRFGLTSPSTPGPTALPSPYPSNPVMLQSGFLDGYEGLQGFLSGYYLNDTGVAVLSIPSFNMSTAGASSFSNAIVDFINFAKQVQANKIVLDVQGNRGGLPILAVDAFNQFFPQSSFYQGERQRASDLLDTLGINTVTAYDGALNTTDVLPETFNRLLQSPFNPVINGAPNGQPYTNWTQYFGPNPFNGGQVTNVQVQNFSNLAADMATGGIVPHGYAESAPPTPAPFNPSDIIILADGACGNTCQDFVNRMAKGAGVKAIVAGGLPTQGPMQYSAGTRGAAQYNAWRADPSLGGLSNDQSFLVNQAGSLPFVNRAARGALNYSLYSLLEQQPYQRVSVNTNGLDGLNPGDSTAKQFLYVPADCRIFYTPAMLTDYKVLWNTAAQFSRGDFSICVPGSYNVSALPVSSSSMSSSMAASSMSSSATLGPQSTSVLTVLPATPTTTSTVLVGGPCPTCPCPTCPPSPTSAVAPVSILKGAGARISGLGSLSTSALVVGLTAMVMMLL